MLFELEELLSANAGIAVSARLATAAREMSFFMRKEGEGLIVAL